MEIRIVATQGKPWGHKRQECEALPGTLTMLCPLHWLPSKNYQAVNLNCIQLIRSHIESFQKHYFLDLTSTDCWLTGSRLFFLIYIYIKLSMWPSRAAKVENHCFRWDYRVKPEKLKSPTYNLRASNQLLVSNSPSWTANQGLLDLGGASTTGTIPNGTQVNREEKKAWQHILR